MTDNLFVADHVFAIRVLISLSVDLVLITNSGFYLTYRREDDVVHTFSKGISLKVSLIVWLGFEKAYYYVIVQNVSH